jgi:glutathione synthase/RimK-type ligase-like ATP-grasp enzyme
MKVLLVFANSSVKKERAYPDDLVAILQAAADKKGKEITIYKTYARSLSFMVSKKTKRIRDHKNHMNLEDYDLVYFRKAGAAMQQMQSCAIYLRDKGVPFYDKELLKASSRNKLSQMFMLERKGLPIPATLFCRNRTRLVRLVTKTYKNEFGFPVIVKATGGSRGDSNYLVHDEKELLQTVKENPSRSFLVQSYVPSDGDFRLFIAGGKVRGVIKRSQLEGSHLSNTSMGAQVALVDIQKLPRDMIHDAELAAMITGRTVAGVDIIVDNVTTKHYLLEVNRAPQIERSSFEEQKGEWMIDAFETTIRDFEDSLPAKKLGSMTVIGAREEACIQLNNEKEVLLKAKIDTGAYTSSLHVDGIRIKGNTLIYTLEGYEVEESDFSQKKVRSSTGEVEVRYIVPLRLSLGEQTYKTKVSLSDRSDMRYPMLIGRKFLTSKRLLVRTDVAYMLGLRDNDRGEKP